MKKPDAKLEAEFNKDGIFFLDQKTLKAARKDSEHYISVDMEIAFPTSAAKDLKQPEFGVSVVNRRGVAILFTDWSVFEREDQTVFQFKISQRIPNLTVSTHGERYYAMTFMDLCFYAGNEAIPENFQVDVYTKPREGSEFVDLGWYLPTRFADALIDAVGKLNDRMLAGVVEHGILYNVTVS